MGVSSHGMILAAKTSVEGKEKLVLAQVAEKVAAGSKVA
jgi:tRNA-binding EMAP/Myf-like protein